MPHAKETRIIYKRIGTPGYTTDIDCYIRNGGYKTLKKAMKAGDPAALCAEVEKAGNFHARHDGRAAAFPQRNFGRGR